MVDGFNEFEEDGEGEMLDFSCIAFCDYGKHPVYYAVCYKGLIFEGRVLVVGDSDRYQVMYWTTTGQKKAAFPGLPERLQHTHEVNLFDRFPAPNCSWITQEKHPKSRTVWSYKWTSLWRALGLPQSWNSTSVQGQGYSRKANFNSKSFALSKLV